MKKTAIAVVAALILASSATGRELTPVSFHARYSMMEDAAELTPAPMCARPVKIVLTSTVNAANVGERLSEKDRGAKQPISMSGDLVAWLHDAVDASFGPSMVNDKADAPIELRIMLSRIVLTETVYRRAEYDGRVIVDVTLVENGKDCWAERFDGFAENYGYAAKEENYQETVNQALDRALFKLLASSQFRDALCGKCVDGK